MKKKTIIPKTKTPASVYLTLFLLVIAMGGFLYYILGIWGIIITCIILGTTSSLYTESGIPAYHAIIVVNSLTGKLRTLFPGLNPKLPWEKAQTDGDKKKYRHLTAEIGEVDKDETYVAKDNALMVVKYTYSFRPDLSGKNPGEDFLKFAFFTDEGEKYVKTAGRAMFSRELSDYYRSKDSKYLLDKHLIQDRVFGSEAYPSVYPTPRTVIDFQKEHGLHSHITLEDSDFDPSTQAYKDLVAQATSVNEALQILINGGASREKAEATLYLMKFPGYEKKDFNFNIDAPHLTNLRDVSILGGLGSSKKEGGKK